MELSQFRWQIYPRSSCIHPLTRSAGTSLGLHHFCRNRRGSSASVAPDIATDFAAPTRLPFLGAVALHVQHCLPWKGPEQLQHLLLPRQEPLLLGLGERLEGEERTTVILEGARRAPSEPP